MAPLDVQIACKKAGAFGGSTMRPNLLKMLRHFEFDRILGIEDVAHLWSTHVGLLHSTSVVPHAAFRRGELFAGSFDEILASPLFRECFEDCFAASMREMNPEALFVALGPTPRTALGWLVDKGVVRAEQVLGSFCHPSSSSGSATPYFLREVTREQLKARNPVRNRCDNLDAAYAEMQASAVRLLGGAHLAPAPLVLPQATPVVQKAHVAANARPPAPHGNVAADSHEADITAIVQAISAAGYCQQHSKTNFAQFTAPNGEIVYLVKKTSRLNKIVLGIHPRLDPVQLARMPGVAEVSSRHMFHSNMRAFPKRRNNGEKENPYAWHVRTDTLGSLERFLHAFAKTDFA
jgi:hypothetical protein